LRLVVFPSQPQTVSDAQLNAPLFGFGVRHRPVALHASAMGNAQTSSIALQSPGKVHGFMLPGPASFEASLVAPPLSCANVPPSVPTPTPPTLLVEEQAATASVPTKRTAASPPPAMIERVL
jgi:hypothetical protein